MISCHLVAKGLIRRRQRLDFCNLSPFFSCSSLPLIALPLGRIEDLVELALFSVGPIPVIHSVLSSSSSSSSSSTLPCMCQDTPINELKILQEIEKPFPCTTVEVSNCWTASPQVTMVGLLERKVMGHNGCNEILSTHSLPGYRNEMACWPAVATSSESSSAAIFYPHTVLRSGSVFGPSGNHDALLQSDGPS